MDKILQGLPHVICFQDNILITGKNLPTHLENLGRVLCGPEKYSIHCKKSKCSFLKPLVEYLGHVINETNLSTSPRKVEAVANAPEHKNVKELLSFLGLVNYYGKFISSLATKAASLNNLLKKNAKWDWSRASQESVKELKQEFTSVKVLAHFNEN
ncbi:uncharacterized mitochondrial protein AtMg00860-like [Carcharodon carcharias]|uniref:uncharacterized mitochondrial protein AtMg00860-like n=1 Tax=Carcharodon carcharias TaxID=13397 RepID=UPI001B7ECA10|nr:uncharacterized mitochondrial protein AtMg00860-like [Carcharodon carcharias]